MQDKTVDLIVKGGLVWLDGNWVEDIAIAINRGQIVDLGATDRIVQRYVATDVLEAQGKFVIPGLVDAHTHLSQQLLRGYTIEQIPMIWARILIPYESVLSPEDVYVSAQLGCLEMIKAGIIGFADAGGPFPEAICAAAEEMGLYATVAPSYMDQGDFIPDNMKLSPDEIAKKFQTFYHKWNAKAAGRIRCFIGLRQIMTVSRELARTLIKLAADYNTGIHLHLAEHKDEVLFSLTHYGCRPVAWLEGMGFFDFHVLAAHCVLLTSVEIRKLVEHKVNIVHCPVANLTSHGFPKVAEIKALGGRVALGSDGASGSPLDLFEAARILYVATRGYYGLPVFDSSPLPVTELLGMMTLASSLAAGITKTGSIKVGNSADLVLIDYESPHLVPLARPEFSFPMFVRASDVTDVIVMGKILMRNREVKVIDEIKLYEHARKKQKEIFSRARLS
ncbi:MAG: amidohydrolase family protein [Candidatus Methanomethylicaceae archaeon]